MTRGLTILAALLAVLAVALPASAADAKTFKGTLVSVSARGIALKDARGVVTTCGRIAKSPSLDGYSPGDAVQAACVLAKGRLVLVKLRHVVAAAPTGTDDAGVVKFGGVVKALTDGSITVHDGDHDLTCSIGDASPPTAVAKVGQRVKVTCTGGVLTALALATTTDAGRAYEGTVTQVGATSITVHTAHGDGTCTVGDGSPSLADVNIGDRVLIGCKADSKQLLYVKKLAAGGDEPSGQTDPHKTTGAAGTVSAVTPHTLTVHTDGGDVTCTVGDGSPSVAELHVGDKVKLGCLDGVLKVVARTDTPPPPADGGDHHNVVTVGGTLTALSDHALTVHNEEHGDLTCTLGPSSPRLGDFHIGDHVGMACADGVLVKITRL